MTMAGTNSQHRKTVRRNASAGTVGEAQPGGESRRHRRPRGSQAQGKRALLAGKDKTFKTRAPYSWNANVLENAALEMRYKLEIAVRKKAQSIRKQLVKLEKSIISARLALNVAKKALCAKKKIEAAAVHMAKAVRKTREIAASHIAALRERRKYRSENQKVTVEPKTDIAMQYVPRGPRAMGYLKPGETYSLKFNWFIGITNDIRKNWALSRKARNALQHALNGNQSFCASSDGMAGGATGRPMIRVRVGKNKYIDTPNTRVNQFAAKAKAIAVTYDIDQATARGALKSLSKNHFNRLMAQKDGIASPYELLRDDLTKALVGKAGAKEIGLLTGWNRWPSDLRHGDKFLEAWLAKHPDSTVNAHGDPYQTVPYGFSLKSDRGPDEWTRLKMKDWAEPVVAINAKSFRQANNIVREQYSHVLRQYLTQTQVVESKDYRDTKNKSLGMFNKLGRNKIEVVNTPEFKAAVKALMRLEQPAYHMAFPKPETLKISKIVGKGARMIVGAALEMEMLERMTSQVFAKDMQENRWTTPSKIGIHNDEWNRLYNEHAGKFAYATDYSFQDLRMPRPFSAASVSMRMEGLPSTFTYMGHHYRTADLQRAMTHGVVDSIVVGPTGQVWSRHQGIPSGMYNTAPINTTNHCILNPYIALESGVPYRVVKDVVESQYGDDNLKSSVIPFLSLKEVERVSKDLNMPFTKDAFGVYLPKQGPIPMSGVFLQRTFQRMMDGTVTARFQPDRLMAKFMTAHSFVETKEQSIDRAVNMLNLTGNCPREYGIISSYIRDMGGKAKSYTEIMRTHYLPQGSNILSMDQRINDMQKSGIEGNKGAQNTGELTRYTATQMVELREALAAAQKFVGDNYHRSESRYWKGVSNRIKFWSAEHGIRLLKGTSLGGGLPPRFVKSDLYFSEYYERFGFGVLRFTPFKLHLGISQNVMVERRRKPNAHNTSSDSGYKQILTCEMKGAMGWSKKYLNHKSNVEWAKKQWGDKVLSIRYKTWQIRDLSNLLLLGGDIESNPGPIVSDPKTHCVNGGAEKTGNSTRKMYPVGLSHRNKDIAERKRKSRIQVEKYRWIKWTPSSEGDIVDGEFVFGDYTISWETARKFDSGMCRRGSKIMLFSPTNINFCLGCIAAGDSCFEQFFSAIWNKIRSLRKEKDNSAKIEKMAKTFGVMTDDEKKILLSQIFDTVGKDPITDKFLQEHFVTGGTQQPVAQTEESLVEENKPVIDEEEQAYIDACERSGLTEAFDIVKTAKDSDVRGEEFKFSLALIHSFVTKYRDDQYFTAQWNAFVHSRLVRHVSIAMTQPRHMVDLTVCCVFCGYKAWICSGVSSGSRQCCYMVKVPKDLPKIDTKQYENDVDRENRENGVGALPYVVVDRLGGGFTQRRSLLQ
nr:RNA-dependent RNA polymerase [Streptobotrys caulophylli yadokari virus 1]